MSRDNGPWAIKYVELGWPVFPCHYIDHGGCTCGRVCSSPGKHPATQHGCKDATNDVAEVQAIWGDNPSWNIGITTGAGMFVVDCDGPEGITAFQELEREHGPLPTTPIAETGGGGHHYYFQCSAPIGNRTKVNGLSIDIRGDGGYVLGPPSNHLSENNYRWKVSPLDALVAEAPEWLLEFVRDEFDTAPAVPKAPGFLADLVDYNLDLETYPGVPEGQPTRLCPSIDRGTLRARRVS